MGIGIAVTLVLLLVLLLPHLFSHQTNNQSLPAPQRAMLPTPTTTAPSPTSTMPANACDNQPQVTINDAANVLDTAQICSAVSQWPYTLAIATTNTSSGNGNLSDIAQSLLTNATTVVMAIGIDHSHHHSRSSLSIISGDSVQISDMQYRRAEEVFTSQANTGDETAATIAALEVLQVPDPNQNQDGGN
jgi:hypothetical protein